MIQRLAGSGWASGPVQSAAEIAARFELWAPRNAVASEAAPVTASTGCVGNRVYTDLGEDELYVMIPGRDVARVAAEAQTIAGANLKLNDYHRERRRALATD